MPYQDGGRAAFRFCKEDQESYFNEKKIVLETRAFGSTVCARSSPFISSDFKRRECKWKFVENACSLSERIAIFSTILASIVGRTEALQVSQEDLVRIGELQNYRESQKKKRYTFEIAAK